MKARVMVAVVGIPFLLLALGWAPDWVTLILVAGMCAIGAHEFMHAAAGEKGRGLIPMTVLAAALMSVGIYAESALRWAERPVPAYTGAVALLFVFALFVYAILHYGKETAVPFASLSAAIFAGLVFPLMLSCLLRLRMIPSIGVVMVFVPLAISFGSDTFALFAGMLFGKHKLAPLVSPKKTVEGAVGGLVGGVLGMALLTYIASYWVIHDAFAGPMHILLFGVVGSVISQIGDLSFSVIKREFGVKDYGKLLPGHGGILDRFDSVTFVAPVVYVLLGLIARGLL